MDVFLNHVAACCRNEQLVQDHGVLDALAACMQQLHVGASPSQTQDSSCRLPNIHSPRVRASEASSASAPTNSTSATAELPQYRIFTFDIETTGFSTTKDAIIEMAVVDVTSSCSWSSLVKPEPYKKSSRGAFNAHGISHYDLLKPQVPTLTQALQALSNFIHKHTSQQPGAVPLLIAHNGYTFDFKALAVAVHRRRDRQQQQQGGQASDSSSSSSRDGVHVMPEHVMVWDTLALARRLKLQKQYDLANLQQATIREHFLGAPPSVVHRALADAQELALLLPHLLHWAAAQVDPGPVEKLLPRSFASFVSAAAAAAAAAAEMINAAAAAGEELGSTAAAAVSVDGNSTGSNEADSGGSQIANGAAAVPVVAAASAAGGGGRRGGRLAAGRASSSRGRSKRLPDAAAAAAGRATDNSSEDGSQLQQQHQLASGSSTCSSQSNMSATVAAAAAILIDSSSDEEISSPLPPAVAAAAESQIAARNSQAAELAAAAVMMEDDVCRYHFPTSTAAAAELPTTSAVSTAFAAEVDVCPQSLSPTAAAAAAAGQAGSLAVASAEAVVATAAAAGQDAVCGHQHVVAVTCSTNSSSSASAVEVSAVSEQVLQGVSSSSSCCCSKSQGSVTASQSVCANGTYTPSSRSSITEVGRAPPARPRPRHTPTAAASSSAAGSIGPMRPLALDTSSSSSSSSGGGGGAAPARTAAAEAVGSVISTAPLHVLIDRPIAPNSVMIKGKTVQIMSSSRFLDLVQATLSGSSSSSSATPDPDPDLSSDLIYLGQFIPGRSDSSSGFSEVLMGSEGLPVVLLLEGLVISKIIKLTRTNGRIQAASWFVKCATKQRAQQQHIKRVAAAVNNLTQLQQQQQEQQQQQQQELFTCMAGTSLQVRLPTKPGVPFLDVVVRQVSSSSSSSSSKRLVPIATPNLASVDAVNRLQQILPVGVAVSVVLWPSCVWSNSKFRGVTLNCVEVWLQEQ